MKERKEKTIYFAGPLFGAADRVHILQIAMRLKRFGYRVILPMQRAASFTQGKDLLDRICADCENQAGRNDILLANIDGPDADSGTSVEFGIARKSKEKPITICIRTDFRTDLGREIGYNAMFRRADGFVYHPSFTLTDDIDISNFYDQLAEKIDAAIMEARRKRDKAKKKR